MPYIVYESSKTGVRFHECHPTQDRAEIRARELTQKETNRWVEKCRNWPETPRDEFSFYYVQFGRI